MGEEMKAGGRRPCELCGGAAAVHCKADAAYLCLGCDAQVHGANFLVARHLRRVTCGACGGFTGRSLSGPCCPANRIEALCRSCGGRDTTASSSSSSSCISSAESSVAPEGKPAASFSSTRSLSRRRAVVEELLARWGRRMGLRGGGRSCVETAWRVLGSGVREMAVVPLRVALAAALWHAVKASGGDEGDAEESNRPRQPGLRKCEPPLRLLEACSGVPARLIVLAESRLARAASRTQALEDEGKEEGWAESS